MAGIMTLSLVACGNGTTKETASTEDATESSVANGDEDGMGEKKVVVAFSQNTTSDPWRVAQTNDIKRVAKERGYELIYTDAQGDTAKQISDVEDICAQGVDILILDPAEYEASSECLTIAKEAGAKVFLIDREVNGTAGEDYVTCIATDFIWNGKVNAEWLIEKTGGTAKIVEITGTPGSAAMIDRQAGFQQGLEGHEGMEIISSQNGNWSRSEAQSAMENIIQSTGGDIDAVYTHNDEMGMGAIQAIEGAGLEPGKDILVVSCDGQKDFVKAIIAGTAGCTASCSPLYGDITFDTIESYLAGEEIPTSIVMDDVLFTADTAEELMDRTY